jgi:alginate O-acetyltransferase complex protein AlgI
VQFNSLDYLVFLAVTLLVFWGLRFSGLERDVRQTETSAGQKVVHFVVRGAWLRLGFFFVASCAFYMSWNPAYLLLIAFSIVHDYLAGYFIGSSKKPAVRKIWFGLSLFTNLGLLGFFKYFNFFSATTGDVLGLLGVEIEPWLIDVAMPVGISFYTFQSLSYTIDVYRGRYPYEPNPLRFAFYIVFYPHLVAGPIVRAAEFLPQVERPPWLTKERVGNGLFLIALGLAKKIIFADFLSVNLVDRVFDDPSLFSSAEVVVGLYAFTLQIYADFAGYTDVARGSAMLFGFDLPENFDRPYQATSVAEFWRRWHITLSTWLRDYLYYPLGGSKGGPARTYFNLWLTIFLIGLWHGGSSTPETAGALWTFVLYGNLQAFMVMTNRAWSRVREKLGWTYPDPLWIDVLKIFATMQFVVFSRILFRASGLENAGDVWAQLFHGTTSLAQIDGDVWRILVLGFFLHYVPRSQLEWLRARFLALPSWAKGLSLAGIGAVVLLFVTGDVVPYIYFQF